MRLPRVGRPLSYLLVGLVGTAVLALGLSTAAEAQQRPWRLHRRLHRVLDGPERNKEFQKTRNTVLAAFLTRGQAQLKLRPAGRVALEWARFLEEAE